MVIYTNFRGMEEAQNSLNAAKQKFSEEMQNLDEIVSATTERDWKGPDAVAFVNSTKEKLNKVRTTYEDFLNSIKNEINVNASKFKDVQQKNLSMIDE